jgi:Zn-dependent peptidase ImmA (M78 family)
MGKFLTPKKDDAGEAICQQQAAKLLQRFKISAPPVDVEQIAHDCGLAVDYVTKGKGFNGRLLKERMVIEVEKSIHLHRQRFTIAHEVGHFVLKHNTVSCYFDTHNASDPRRLNEYHANVFASELLMPGPWVQKFWQELRDYRVLAERFIVSPEAMFRRLESAGLLGL